MNMCKLCRYQELQIAIMILYSVFHRQETARKTARQETARHLLREDMKEDI